MTAAMIAQLVIALGPVALDLIQDLVSVWNKPSLTPEEVLAIVSKTKKSYDDYITEAKANQLPIPVP